MALTLESQTLAGDSMEFTASSKALSDPIILDIVLPLLNVPSLKAARLTCRQWCEIATPLLGQRTFLNGNKFDTFKATQQTDLVVDDQLLKRLYFSSAGHRNDFSLPYENWPNVIKRVISAIPQAAQLTRELSIEIGNLNFVNTHFRGMESWNALNLKHVTVSVYMTCNMIPPFVGQVPLHNTLTSLKFKMDFRKGVWPGEYYFNQEILLPIWRAWLWSAPNLTSLEIEGTTCPNLISCDSLKVLKFRFEGIDDLVVALDLAAVTRMLEQVKGSLVHVELDYFTRGISTLQRVGKLALPVMPNVVDLLAADVYQILDLLNEHSLPNLKNLTLVNFFETPGLDYHPNFWTPHHGIQSLTLSLAGSTKCNQFAATLVKLYPSVTKLDFTWKLFGLENLDLGLMEPFKLWNLNVANVVMKQVCDSNIVIPVIRTILNWKGVKTAKFYFYLNLTKSRFTGHLEEMIHFSDFFKTLEMGVCLDSEFVDQMRSIFEARRAAINVKRVAVEEIFS